MTTTSIYFRNQLAKDRPRALHRLQIHTTCILNPPQLTFRLALHAPFPANMVHESTMNHTAATTRHQLHGHMRQPILTYTPLQYIWRCRTPAVCPAFVPRDPTRWWRRRELRYPLACSNFFPTARACGKLLHTNESTTTELLNVVKMRRARAYPHVASEDCRCAIPRPGGRHVSITSLSLQPHRVQLTRTAQSHYNRSSRSTSHASSSKVTHPTRQSRCSRLIHHNHLHIRSPTTPTRCPSASLHDP